MAEITNYPKFIPNGKFNRFGFFEVGDQQFYSKLDAIHYSTESGNEVTWNFNNSILESYDWTKEPEGKVEDYYRQRAQQIRDKYDYVVLMFSGGCDSTNVINSFIDNSIFPDEVFCMHTMDGNYGDPNSFMNCETFYLAIPHAIEKLKKSPGTRLTIHDNSDWERQMLCDPVNREFSWRAYNNIHNVAMCGRYHSPTVSWPQRFPRWRKLIDEGKSVVFVWGDVKARVLYDHKAKKHYYQCEDHYPHLPTPHVQWCNDPTENHEHFYSQPDIPELMIKQAHTIFNKIKNFKNEPNDWWEFNDKTRWTISPWGFEAANLKVSGIRTADETGTEWMLDADIFHQMIYPGWKPGYPQWKQRYRVNHPWHRWLAKEFPKETKLWYKSYIEAFANLPEEWTQNRGGLEQNLKRLENKYYLE